MTEHVWQAEIDELAYRKSLAAEMGGAERVGRQHEFGKLTIRERFDAFADPGSFEEVGGTAGLADYDDDGKLISFTPANFLVGVANVDGRPVVLSGDDFTVRGGSSELSIGAKRAFSEDIALELALPHIRLVDGMGGGGSVKSMEKARRPLIPQAKGMDVIGAHLATAPSVSLALGSVAGIGAARVAMSHYSVIVEETAQMMIAGPALVEQAGQPAVTKEDLGHARVHTSNGAIDDAASSEAEAFAMAKRFLSYLPRNVHELPARIEPCDDPSRRDDELASIIPRNERQIYDVRKILDHVVDRNPDGESSFFEIGRSWGRSVVGGLARLDGWPVAIFTEDPKIYGGAWTADGSQKLIRLLDLASTFHLPTVHLEDCPGFLIGKQAEDDATIRHGSRALVALAQHKTPFASIVIRKAFGVAGAANRKPGSTHFRWSWPSGRWGSLPVQGGIEVAYKAELAELDEEAVTARVAEIRQRLDQMSSPFLSAETFAIDDIIDPRETRPLLCNWANLVADARQPGQESFTYRP
ncbi:MAG: methylmalonyl-CoA carboxyltransferase [Actinomycetia bacterium]|nr:methylmalonyl-CoA carboxyltransferase [Actinomycetes bacterium]